MKKGKLRLLIRLQRRFLYPKAGAVTYRLLLTSVLPAAAVMRVLHPPTTVCSPPYVPYLRYVWVFCCREAKKINPLNDEVPFYSHTIQRIQV